MFILAGCLSLNKPHLTCSVATLVSGSHEDHTDTDIPEGHGVWGRALSRHAGEEGNVSAF